MCFLDPGLIQLPNFHSTVHWNVLRETFYLHLHMHCILCKAIAFWKDNPFSLPSLFSGCQPGQIYVAFYYILTFLNFLLDTLHCNVGVVNFPWRCWIKLNLIFYWFFYFKITRRPQSKPLIWSKSMVFLMVKQQISFSRDIIATVQ